MVQVAFVLNTISAGFPSPADDYIEQKLDLNEYLVPRPSSTFFVRVQGHSMVDANIHDGDILIVDRSLTAAHGSIVVALVDGEFTVKRLAVKNSTFYLMPANSQFTPQQISSESNFEIWGVVTYTIHKAHVRPC